MLFRMQSNVLFRLFHLLTAQAGSNPVIICTNLWDCYKIKVWSLRFMAVLLAICGVKAFVKNEIASYLFLRTQFVFIDFSQPVVRVLFNYLAVIILFAMIGYYTSKWIGLLTKVHRKNSKGMKT